MISIIMGVYNGEKYLKEAIDSIIYQTYKNWEFIICDDCSTDNSLKILNEYKQADERINIIRNSQNMGLAASLNHCLQFVKGRYIARMDCDDISVPDRLEKQIQYMEENPEIDLVGTYMQGFNADGKNKIIKQCLNPTKYDLPKGNPFHHATVVMKTEIIKKMGGYKVKNYTLRMEDVDLWYRFFEMGFKGENIPEALYLVRLDENAYKRRKLKYMLHASYIMWNGISLLKLPWFYKIYCFKPILSWMLPESIKQKLRR